jgi:hypothetical protein
MIRAPVIAEALIVAVAVPDTLANARSRAPVKVSDVAAVEVMAARKFVPVVPPSELMVIDSSLAKDRANVLPPAVAVPVAVAVVPTVAEDVPRLTTMASAAVFRARVAVTVTSKSSVESVSALAKPVTFSVFIVEDRFVSVTP